MERTESFHQRNRERTLSFLAVSATCISLFFVYLLSLPSEIALEDDGYFTLSALSFGLSHPPGYPLFSWLAGTFIQLPFGTPAFRMHLLSAIFSVLAMAVMWWCVYRLVRDRWLSTLAVLIFGLSERYWSQSIVAEVYSLNALLVFCFLWLILFVRDDQYVSSHWFKPYQQAFVLGVCYGLGLSNHWPLFFTYTLFLWLLIGARLTKISFIFWVLVGLVLGLTPYIWMYLVSQKEPTFNFFGLLPITDFSEFISYVKRDYYSELEGATTASLVDKLRFATFFAKELFFQLTPVGFLLSLFGWLMTVREDPKLGWVLAAMASFPVAMLILFVDFNYDEFMASVMRVYPLITYGLTALMIAKGLRVLADRSQTNMPDRYINSLLVVVAISLTIWLGYGNHEHNNRRHYHWAKDYALGILDLLPKDSVLFVSGDTDIATLAYYRELEVLRPDVDIQLAKGHLAVTPLTEHYGPWSEQDLKSMLKVSNRPIYSLRGSLKNVLPPTQANEAFGLLQLITLENDELKARVFGTGKQLELMNKLVTYTGTDLWTLNQIDDLIKRLGYLVSCNNLPLSNTTEQQLVASRQLVAHSISGIIGMVEGHLFCAGSFGLAKSLLANIIPKLDSDQPRELRSKVYLYYSQLLLTESITDKQALYFMELALETFPSAKNIAVGQLARLYELLNEDEKLAALKERF